MISPMFSRTSLWWHLRDALSIEDETREPEVDDPPTLTEIEQCRRDRMGACDRRTVVDPIGPNPFRRIDLEAEAAQTVYRHNGINKRRRYAPVDLSRRCVVIVLHQTGTERSVNSPRWPLVTCHRLILPDGTRAKVHPLNTRLVAANRLDRAPFHAISIEIAGNFEGTDGTGDWWSPHVMGRGRASDAQIEATRQEVRAIRSEVDVQYGGRVVAIVPHRVSSRKPKKPKCPGSRPWSLVGEWAGATLGLAVPADGFTIGGLPLPEQWHGPYWASCERTLPRGWMP